MESGLQNENGKLYKEWDWLNDWCNQAIDSTDHEDEFYSLPNGKLTKLMQVFLCNTMIINYVKWNNLFILNFSYLALCHLVLPWLCQQAALIQPRHKEVNAPPMKSSKDVMHVTNKYLMT